MNTSGNPLVNGILADARKKADEIISKARSDAASILADAEERARKGVAAEEKSLDLRLEQIRLRKESARKSLDRISELRALDCSYSEVMDEVSRRLGQMAGTAEFRSVLIAWITEAVIGLDRKEAKVSFSERTPVTPDMLREAEAEVRRRTGASVTLTEDPERLSEGGVSVSSLDGKVSYNNQLPVRIRRFQRDIKRIIQEENARQNSR